MIPELNTSTMFCSVPIDHLVPFDNWTLFFPILEPAVPFESWNTMLLLDQELSTWEEFSTSQLENSEKSSH